MIRPMTIILAGALALSVSACYTPQAARDAGTLLAKHTTTYKTSLETFVTKSNTHRAASATNLGMVDASANNIEGLLENLKLEWKLAGNKTADSTLATLNKHMKARDGSTPDNLAFFAARRDVLAARFGKVEYSTKTLDSPIKAYEALAADDDLSLDVNALLPLLSMVADTKKLDGTLVGDLLDKATEEAEKKGAANAAAVDAPK